MAHLTHWQRSLGPFALSWTHIHQAGWVLRFMHYGDMPRFVILSSSQGLRWGIADFEEDD